MPEPETVAAETPADVDLVEVILKREMGKCTLTIKNKGLLDYLKELGAMTPAGRLTADPGWADGIDNFRHTIAPLALVKHTADGQYELAVHKYYNAPVTAAQLKSIGQSVNKAMADMLEYFRPIEVSAKVTLKGR